MNNKKGSLFDMIGAPTENIYINNKRHEVDKRWIEIVQIDFECIEDLFMCTSGVSYYHSSMYYFPCGKTRDKEFGGECDCANCKKLLIELREYIRKIIKYNKKYSL